jgi:hypothetical protein
MAELLPGDKVYFARSKETAPIEVMVQCVVPQFHLPDVYVLDLTRKLENVYEDAMLPTGPVAFDEGIAFALKVPGVHENRRPEQYLEGNGPGYGASGPTISNNRIGKAEKLELLNFLHAKEKVGSVVDIIDLPSEVRRQLQQRGADLLAAFGEEKGGLKALSEGQQAFWNHCLKTNIEASLRQMKSEHSEFAATNIAIDATLAMAAEKMPYEEASASGMERWMTMLMDRREKFIANSSTARFSEVVFLETVIGSWLHQMGATNTADQLQDEVVELSLLAACDPDRGKVRARVENLKMLLLVETPTFISGLNPNVLKDFPIDIPAQEAIKSWGSRNQVELVTTNGTVSLEAVQAQLVAEVGKSMAPFIAGIPNISANGDLNEKPWPVAWENDFQQNGEDLKTWLHDLALDVALRYSDSPAVQASGARR